MLPIQNYLILNTLKKKKDIKEHKTRSSKKTYQVLGQDDFIISLKCQFLNLYIIQCKLAQTQQHF